MPSQIRWDATWYSIPVHTSSLNRTPFSRYGLRGHVQNQLGEVEIVAAGSPHALERFLSDLVQCAPPLSSPRLAEVVDIAPADVEPPPSFGTRIRVDFLKGMGRSGRKFVLMLDVDRVLSAHELLAAAGVGDDPAGQELGA